MSEIFIDNGNTSDVVEQQTNTTGEMTAIAAISPSRGTWIRLLNEVAKGDETGVPIYMDLRDSAGNPLPSNTSIEFQLAVAGANQALAVSQRKGNISTWNSLGLNAQRNTDNVDSVKIDLQEPEIQGGEMVDKIDWRDIDDVYFAIDSAAQIDWSQSAFYVDSNAVKGPFSRE